MICTFYSFKGGVGRSMAMANVARIFSRRELKTLMIDFDLEAPGLERFFQMNQEGVRRNPGLLDLLLSYKQAMSVGGDGEQGFARLASFVRPVYEKLPGGGILDILPAGQREEPEQLARYALNLRTFDWQDFYFNWKGALFFDWLRKSLLDGPPAAGTPAYDLVLADSRTGVTEMGGICGYQLADVIVMLCAANHQNVDGTLDMVRDFRSAANLRLRGGRPLTIIVVPARVEQRDEKLRDDFFSRFDAAFAKEIPEALSEAGMSFRDLAIPYDPSFAFEEQVVDDASTVEQQRSISTAFHRLADAIALVASPAEKMAGLARDEKARWPTGTTPAHLPAGLHYDPAKRFADYDFFIDSSSHDREASGKLAASLTDAGSQVFFDREDNPANTGWRATVEEALFHTQTLLYCVGEGPLSDWRLWTLERALGARERGQRLQIIPVLLPGSNPEMLRSTPLASIQPLDLRSGNLGLDSRLVLQAAARPPGRSPTVESETRAPYIGSRPYEELDASLLSGRQELLRQLTEKLSEGRRFIALAGPPGVGKTSLVRAGLVPAVRAGAVPGRWRIVFPDDESPAAGAEDEFPLVVVDDVDSLFAEAAPATLETAIARLAPLVAKGGALLVLVRDDQLPGLLAAHPEFDALKMAPMSSTELRQVCEIAAERVGLAFEPGLVERLVADLPSEGGALGLLQQALETLWKDRRGGWLTNAAYDRAGGLAGMVTVNAEREYAALGDGAKAALRSLLLRLVLVHGTLEITRRPVPWSAALARSRGDADLTIALRAFLRIGLLVVSEKDGAAVLKCTEPALLSKWQTFRELIEAEREFLFWRERINASLSAWRETNRSAGELPRGKALREGLRWIRERRMDLTLDEIAFVNAGVRRNRLVLGVTFAIFVPLLTIALVWRASLVKTLDAESVQVADQILAQDSNGGEPISKADARAALSKYEAAIQRDPENPTYRFKRALAYRALNEFDLAKADLDSAISFSQKTKVPDGEISAFHQARARVSEALSDPSGAAVDALSAARLQPRSADLWLESGRLQQTLAESPHGPSGARSEAIAAYSTALTLKPDSAPALFNRAVLEEQAGQKGDAIRDFTAVTGLKGASQQYLVAANVRLASLGAKPQNVTLPPAAAVRVYLRYSSAADKAVMQRLVTHLPGYGKAIEPVDLHAVGSSSNVRYFFRQDERSAFDVKELVERSLAEEGIATSLRLIFRDADRFPGASPGLIEVWLLPLSSPLPSPKTIAGADK